MREKYANGLRSTIFRISSEERLRFPVADLVKEDLDSDRQWFARLFYRHKIAHLLFPNNFVKVVAAIVEPHQPYLYEDFDMGKGLIITSPVDRLHRLYSQLADVAPDHATYASHMKLVFDRETRWTGKRSVCSCAACVSHGEDHETRNIEQGATEFSGLVSQIGIGLDPADPSDYCISSGGDIIFFEIDKFEPKKLRVHLESIIDPSHVELEALTLLGRHDELDSISRQDLLSGKSNKVRVN